MSEYEVATLAARHVGIRIAAGHVVTGFGQIAVVAWGIRAMQRAGDQRARDQDQRHAGTMDALAM